MLIFPYRVRSLSASGAHGLFLVWNTRAGRTPCVRVLRTWRACVAHGGKGNRSRETSAIIPRRHHTMDVGPPCDCCAQVKETRVAWRHLITEAYSGPKLNTDNHTCIRLSYDTAITFFGRYRALQGTAILQIATSTHKPNSRRARPPPSLSFSLMHVNSRGMRRKQSAHGSAAGVIAWSSSSRPGRTDDNTLTRAKTSYC